MVGHKNISTPPGSKPPFAGTPDRIKSYSTKIQTGEFMRSLLLWGIGIPVPIIIILWLVSGHA